MKKKIYTITQKSKNWITEICKFKTAVFLAFVFVSIQTISGQGHNHDHDTLKVLGKTDFSVSILSNSSNLLQLEVINNQSDSITPIFIEFSGSGFQFTNECILQQTINNINVESNIEKIWGPAFVSVGISSMPPSGRFVTNLAIINGLATGSKIKVRIYGSVGGQDILWSGIITH